MALNAFIGVQMLMLVLMLNKSTNDSFIFVEGLATGFERIKCG